MKYEHEVKSKDSSLLKDGIKVRADRLHNGFCVELATWKRELYWRKSWRGAGSIDACNTEIGKLKKLAIANNLQFCIEDYRFNDVKIIEG